MSTPRFEAYTLAGKPVGVTVAALDQSAKSTAAIDAVLLKMDPGFIRVVGFAIPGGHLMNARGNHLEVLALVITSDWDGNEGHEWAILPPLEVLEARGVAMLAAKLARDEATVAANAAHQLLLASLMARALAVVPELLRAEWERKMSDLIARGFDPARSSFRRAEMRIGDADGYVVRGLEDTMTWDLSPIPVDKSTYDGGGSGYGRHAD